MDIDFHGTAVPRRLLFTKLTLEGVEYSTVVGSVQTQTEVLEVMKEERMLSSSNPTKAFKQNGISIYIIKLIVGCHEFYLRNFIKTSILQLLSI